MHDLRVVRERLDELREAMRRRGTLGALATQLDACEELERERRLLMQAAQERQAARNAESQEVARRRKAGEDASELIAHGRTAGEEIARLESEVAEVEGKLNGILMHVPNMTLPDVPEGDEEHNVIVRSWGTPRPVVGVKPHWDIAEAFGLVDLERGAKISGSGFAAYRGTGARLIRALMNFFLDSHADEHGYEEVWPPLLVTRDAMTGTGQLPKFEDDAYKIAGDDLFLIPTAEVPVTNLYRGEILDGDSLPRGFVAYTPCFRREAGSAGKDTRGIQRMHQFDKVELVRYSAADDSERQLELLLGHAESMLQRLGLPYRVKLLAAGDTGFSSAKTYDLEAWAPGVGSWLEVSSVSTFTDFQARRANIRYRAAKGEKPKFIHTLNGSGLAFPRTLACILEHYQQTDGTVVVPDVLRPYVGTDRIS